MSYRKSSSKTLSNSRNVLYNPESVYTHMKRMQNLLDEYDEENSFLNNQVLQLLDQKRKMQNKYTLTKGVDNQNNKKQLISQGTQNLKRTNSSYISKQSSSKKKKYEYIDKEDRSFSPLHNNPDKNKSANTETNSNKLFFTRTPYDRVNNKNQQSYKYLQQKNVGKKVQVQTKQFILKSQPQQIARNLIDHQLIKPSYQNTLGKSNVMPILKKDPYIRSPDQNKSLKSNCPSRNSISPNLSQSKLSNKSKKSGIHVISSSILKPQQNALIKSSQNQKSKQFGQFRHQIKQKSPQKNQKRVSFSDEQLPMKLTESLIKKQSSQQAKSQLIENKEIKNQRLSRQHLYSMNITQMLQNSNKKNMIANPQQSKYNLEATQTGINTEPVYNEMNLMKNRSMSQHRINPSEKIMYQNLNRKQSNPNLRDVSRERQSKKKFINIVSNAVLSQKLGQTQKANRVYK